MGRDADTSCASTWVRPDNAAWDPYRSDCSGRDAINNDHHTMLFASWIVEGSKARFLEEPACSSDQPYAREYIANVTLMGETLLVQYRGTYTTIRHDP